LVLGLLNTSGQISRADLARATGLTKTSITNIINELIKEGIICETGASETPSGRKPLLLNLVGNALHAIGVIIGRNYIYSNIMTLGGEIIQECKVNLEAAENERSIVAYTFSVIDTVLKNSGVDKTKILGIGIASIGPLDLANGIIVDPPNFRGLHSIPIVKLIKERYGMPTFMDNDMNACSIAEKLFGNAKKVENFIFVGVGNGIGAGIFLDNVLFRGNNGFAGEIGHTTIDVHGEKCPCGNSGCLELYASIPSIMRQVATSISYGAASSLSNRKDLTWQDIVEAAKSGDGLSVKVIERITYYLSVGLVNIVNLCDPDVIYIGNELSIAGDLFIRQLNELVNRNLLFRTSKHIRIELSKFRDNASFMGAPSIVLYRFFSGKL
jgi:predicted NBD/HSP70 family sugar kinase